jgi:hypothetical protein
MFNYFVKLNSKNKYAYYLVLIFITIPRYLETRVPDNVQSNSVKYWRNKWK